jgi:hypothetical protein
MPTAWNAWYHLTSNSYGTWLRGDPRGWRERHHRKHVEGDYKNPPKRGTGDKELQKSKDLMQRAAVRLEKRLRGIALLAIVLTLLGDGMDVIIASLDDHHLHLLARFRDHQPRKRLGWAKFYATKAVKEYISHCEKTHGGAVGFQLNLKPGEGLWAKRSKAIPIKNRSHQLNVVKYVADHRNRGAILFMQPAAERWLKKEGKL